MTWALGTPGLSGLRSVCCKRQMSHPRFTPSLWMAARTTVDSQNAPIQLLANVGFLSVMRHAVLGVLFPGRCHNNCNPDEDDQDDERDQPFRHSIYGLRIHLRSG